MMQVLSRLNLQGGQFFCAGMYRTAGAVIQIVSDQHRKPGKDMPSFTSFQCDAQRGVTVHAEAKPTVFRLFVAHRRLGQRDKSCIAHRRHSRFDVRARGAERDSRGISIGVRVLGP